MANVLAKWAEAHGLSMPSKQAAAGYMGGYPLSVALTQKNVFQCRVCVDPDGEEKLQALKESLRARKEEFGPLPVAVKKNALSFDIGLKKFRDAGFGRNLREILRLIGQAGFEPAAHCAACSRDTRAAVWYQDNVQVMCESCQRKQAEAAKTGASQGGVSVLTGLLGALLGALVGIIPYILLAHFAGILSGWLAFLVCLGGYFGYKLFKGARRPAVAYTVIILCSLVAIVAAVAGAEMYAFYSEVAADANASVSEVMEVLPMTDFLKLYLHQDPWGVFPPSDLNQATFELWKDMGFSLLFGLIGFFVSQKLIRSYAAPSNPIPLPVSAQRTADSWQA